MKASASTMASTARPVLSSGAAGIFEMPISAPNQGALRTTPRNTKPTPMVTIARKSSRTRRLAMPVITPASPAASAPISSASPKGTPLTALSAVA